MARKKQKWFLKQGEGEAGPFSGRELRQLAAAGKLSNDDEIRSAGGNKWYKASSVRNLFARASNHTKQQASVPVGPGKRNSDSIPVVPPKSSVVVALQEAIPTTSKGSREDISNNDIADGEESVQTTPCPQLSTNRSELKKQEEALTQELVDLILLDNSSVKDDPAFQELWRENSRLLTRRELLSDLDRKTIGLLPDIEQAENKVADARKLLAMKEKELHGFDTDLGKAAFAALLVGQVADHPRFARRSELHSRIESLAQQQSGFATELDAKLMDKAKSQAQRLKLAGQIKVSELEIGSLNRSIGRSIIEASEEESVRCEPTDAIIETIQEHRRMITAASETFRDAELNLADVKSSAAEALGRPIVRESKSIRVELKQNRREIGEIERSITAVRHTVVTKAMDLDELHNDAQLGAALKNLRSIQSRIEGIKPGALKFFERQIARWQAGPVGFRYGSIAVATVIFLIAVVMFFREGPDANKRASRPEIIESALSQEIVPITNRQYQKSGFKNFRFGESKSVIEKIALTDKVELKDGIQRFFYDDRDRFIGYERLYKHANNEYLSRLKQEFGPVPSDNISEASNVTRFGTSSNYMNSTGSSVRRSESALVRFYMPNSVAYAVPTWNKSADSNISGVSQSEHMLLNVFSREWLLGALSEHESQVRNSIYWIESNILAKSQWLDLSSVPNWDGAKRQITFARRDKNVQILSIVDRAAKDFRNPFISMDIALIDTSARKAGSIQIGLDCLRLPREHRPDIYRYTLLTMEAHRLNVLLLQEIFPPSSDFIRTSKQAAELQKTYSWETLDGWSITVRPPCSIHLSNRDSKKL